MFPIFYDSVIQINSNLSHIGMIIHTTTLDTEEKVKATIKIVPIRPVEDFEIDIVLTDSTVEVTTA